MLALTLVSIAFVGRGAPAASLPVSAPPAPAAAVQAQRFAELGLTIQPPPLEGITFQAAPGERLSGSWSGRLGARSVEVFLVAFPAARFRFVEAEEVSEFLRSDLRERAEWTLEEWDSRSPLSGAYGASPIAALATGTLRLKGEPRGSLVVLTGITADHGYALQAFVDAPEDGAERRALAEWARKAVAYDGKPRDPRWTDEEARARWQAFAPAAAVAKLETPIRTAHFLILTNSSGGKAFAKKMEECYALIQRTYPFPELPGRRLMPVFLFRTQDEYYEFSVKAANMSRAAAEATAGHAFRDYYATTYEAPNDPVHVHEATHQIFTNRLFLGGGGSWFQEGVAEYLSSKPNERNAAARAVKKGRHVPLREFVAMPELIAGRGGADKSGEDEAGSNYEQAALLVEFLRESKWSAPKFQELVRGLGLSPSNDVVAVERVLQRVLGVGLDGLEERWIEYCKKR